MINYIKYGGAAVVIILIGLYIIQAEGNKKTVLTLTKNNKDLAEANLTLTKDYQEQVALVQNVLNQDLKGEKRHAENIKIINQQPSIDCARRSPAIVSTIRLLREQRDSDLNPKASDR